MSDMEDKIEEVDRLHRDANMSAMSAHGWKRAVFFAFARFFDWAGKTGRNIQRDEQRGKDDTYHDEY